MHNHSRTLGLATALLCGVPAGAQAQTSAPLLATGNVNLRYKFIPGQTVRYKLALDEDGIYTDPDGTMTTKTHLDVALHQTVQSVRASDGAATLATRIDSATLTVNGTPVTITPHAQQQFTQAITSVMTPTGRVLSVNAPDGTYLPDTGLYLSDLQNLRVLPDQAVNVNGTWLSTKTFTFCGLKARFCYTLTKLSVDGVTATIAQTYYGEFKSPKAASATPSKRKENDTLTGTGTETFDIAAGQIASQTNDILLKTTSTPPGSTRVIKTDDHITSDMERVPGGGTNDAPADEPPTGQLQ